MFAGRISARSRACRRTSKTCEGSSEETEERRILTS